MRPPGVYWPLLPGSERSQAKTKDKSFESRPTWFCVCQSLLPCESTDSAPQSCRRPRTRLERNSKEMHRLQGQPWWNWKHFLKQFLPLEPRFAALSNGDQIPCPPLARPLVHPTRSLKFCPLQHTAHHSHQAQSHLRTFVLSSLCLEHLCSHTCA